MTVLATRGLARRFGARSVIAGLDMHIPRGAVYGFLGRNGAGKTTTLRMLMGILSPHGGTLEFEGESLPRMPPRLRRRIGYVSQEQHFYDWMKVKHLGRFCAGFYPDWEPARFARLLDELAVEPGQRVGTLSGGTKMKLAFALALAHDPPLLVLDEPTAGVDPIARREILELMRGQAEQHGRTVLFSTHHLAEVEDVGTVVGVLHGGRLAFEGPVAELGQVVRRVARAELPDGAQVLHDDGETVLAQAPLDRWASGEPLGVEAAFIAIATSTA